MSVSVVDNTSSVESALRTAIAKGLDSAGARAEEYAKETVHVITGNLRDSISHEASDNAVVVYAGMDYAPYEELGTSKQDAHPYLRPAVMNHTDELLELIGRTVESAL